MKRLFFALLLLAPIHAFAFSPLLTASSDTLTTFRTNQNTNWTNITTDLTAGTYSFSTTSANWWSTFGLGFSTTSSNYWKTQNNFFSTTSADYWITTKSTSNLTEGSNLYYTDARVNAYIHASTTIPKTYSNNTFGGTQTFNNLTVNGTCTGCGAGGSSFPFTATTNYGALTNSTSTPLWLTAGLQASSTAYLQHIDIGPAFSIKQAGNIVFHASSSVHGIFVGQGAGSSLASGNDYNTLVGYNAGNGVTTGGNNTIVGGASTAANENLTTGSGNIKLGFNISFPSVSANNQLNIGNILFGRNIDGSAKTYSTGELGVGSTSPAARFSIHANNGDSRASNWLFAIGSSTASATTTLFSVSNIGSTTLGLFGTCSGSNALQTSSSGTITCGAISAASAASSTLLADSNTFSGALNTFSNTIKVSTLSGLIGGNSGTLYAFASSSLFGYTPLNPTRNINTTWPILGGGDLSADRTITFGGLSTSSAISAASGLLYATGVNTLASVSTSSAISMSITGNAGTVTTNANLSGAVTSSGSNVTAFGSQSAGVLGSAITGIPSMQATSSLYGASTGGMVLGWSNTTGGIAWIATSSSAAVTSAFEIATTSSIAAPQLAYFTQTGGRTTLGSVATGTVSAGTGISLDSSIRSVIGGALTITNTGVTSLGNGTGVTCTGTAPGSCSLAAINANTVLVNNTSASAIPSAIATSTFFGTGTPGNHLVWLSGVPTWSATSTYSGGTGISTSFSNNALTITNTIGFPFTQTTFGSNANATTTLIGLNGGLYSTAASSTFVGGVSFAYATSTTTFTLPAGTSVASLMAGNIAIDTSADQLRYFGTAVRNLTYLYSVGFSYSSTTQGMGSTTRYLAPAPANITFSHAQCDFSNFLGISLYDGTNRSTYFVASSTIGTTTLATNNTFTMGESMRVDIGTSTNIASSVTGGCRFFFTYDSI